MEVVRVERPCRYGSPASSSGDTLPSWGEPILPEVWIIPEEEMNEKFPLPGSSSSSLEDHVAQDCCMLKMPLCGYFGHENVDDMQPLFRNSEDTGRSAGDTTMRSAATTSMRSPATTSTISMRCSSSSSSSPSFNNCKDDDDCGKESGGSSVVERKILLSSIDMLSSENGSIMDSIEVQEEEKEEGHPHTYSILDSIEEGHPHTYSILDSIEVQEEEKEEGHTHTELLISPSKYGGGRDLSDDDVNDEEEDDDVSLNSYGLSGGANILMVTNQNGFSSGTDRSSSNGSMNLEGGKTQTNKSAAEWIVEARLHGPQQKNLRFNLKTSTGVSMLVYPSEILGAVKAIIDDETEEGILFEICPIDSTPILVKSSEVMKELSATMIAARTRTRLSKSSLVRASDKQDNVSAVEARDGCPVPDSNNGDYKSEKRRHNLRTIRVPAFIRRNKDKDAASTTTSSTSSSTLTSTSTSTKRFKRWNNPQHDHHNRKHRFGISWKALSGRSKARSPPSMSQPLLMNHRVE